MQKSDTPIHHVMDTAFWVATYRAEESARSDALFRDPFAALLTEDSAGKFREMYQAKYVRWTVVTRTVIIDRYIEELLAQGVDTVLNLGAGLDTRPYRMNLPQDLKWIEVDYDSTIRLKNEKLAGEKPRCRLERVSLDLSSQAERQKLFARVAADAGAARKVLVLTEGVIPYLTEEDVGTLAEDLHAQENFGFWISEYLAPVLYPYFKNRRRNRQMKNAPFRFMPPDWYGFFDQRGWRTQETRYTAEESKKLGRPTPMPWWVRFLRVFLSGNSERMRKFSGFILFARK